MQVHSFDAHGIRCCTSPLLLFLLVSMTLTWFVHDICFLLLHVPSLLLASMGEE
jgi:hypothetical protein